LEKEEMNKSRFSPFNVLGIVIALLICLTVVARSQGDQKIKAKNLPAAVTAAFQKAYPNAKIKGASKEMENGKAVYEVESVDGKIRRDLLYNADGTCVEIEETVPLKALPSDVTDALKKGFPGGKVMKSEKLMKGETIQYELVIQSGKEKHEVVFDAKGLIVKDTKMNAKAKEDKEENERD
jgi:uncharacterized membrane protein YkoI